MKQLSNIDDKIRVVFDFILKMNDTITDPQDEIRFKEAFTWVSNQEIDNINQFFDFPKFERETRDDGSICYYQITPTTKHLHRLDGPAAEGPDGYKAWCQNGLLHRIDGPAVEHINGTKEWYQNGEYHRLEGPAVECVDGSKSWYQNGKAHRLDGPAIEYANGYKAWYQNGKRHRLDGPAVEFSDGREYWYIEGQELTKEQFDEHIKSLDNLSNGS